MKRCPHPNVVYCPLYAAAHEPDGLGCDDGNLAEHEGCAVDRGVMDYNAGVAALCRVRPDTVRERAEAENAAMARQQRQRNLRAAGVH